MIRRKRELAVRVTDKNFSPTDVIASLLFFMKSKFNNDPKIIHTTIAKLKENESFNI